MRTLDLVVAVLLLIGGVNWGLVGAFNFNLVEEVFGRMGGFVTLIYVAIGLSAVYQLVQFKALMKKMKK
jgi:uncharacterized protein